VLEAIAGVEQRLGTQLATHAVAQARKGDHLWYVSDMRKLLAHIPRLHAALRSAGDPRRAVRRGGALGLSRQARASVSRPQRLFRQAEQHEGHAKQRHDRHTSG
jgi:hypothetical protein